MIKSAPQQGKELVRASILELMLSGMGWSCLSMHLTEQGENAVKKVIRNYHIDTEAVTRAIFSRNNFKPLDQADFMNTFLYQLLTKGGGQVRAKTYRGLYEYLNSQIKSGRVKKALEIGIQPRTLLCAIAITIKEDASKKGIIKELDRDVYYVPRYRRLVA